MVNGSEDYLSVVGDECHLVSGEANGPRSSLEIPGGEVDGYANLILLCKIHHKCIDDHPEIYKLEKLVEVKQEHEKWVEATLSERGKPRGKPPVLTHIAEGREVLAIIGSSHLFDFDHDELVSEEEVELVASFLQDAQDWGDLYGELGSAEQVRASFGLKGHLQTLEGAGFWVFGARKEGRYRLRDIADPVALTTSILRVLRSSNPLIVKNQKAAP